MRNLVFVYGTLKRGYGNNHILAQSKLLGEGQTVARCRLYDAGFPVLRRRTNRDGAWNAPVRGEVYEVTSQETMDRLDRLEGEGHMYHRRRKKIQLDSGEVVMAYAYVGDARFWGGGRVRLYPEPVNAYEWSRGNDHLQNV
jgi:gamma-glutamylaminecyclotransferase